MSTEKVTKATLLSHNAIFQAKGKIPVEDSKITPKISYWIAKNVKVQEAEVSVIETVRSSLEKSEESTKYNTERQAFIELHAVKKEDGTPEFEEITLENGMKAQNYKLADEEAFKVELEKFNAERKDLIDSINSRQNEFLKLLTEEVEITPFKISFKEITKGLLTTQEMFSLLSYFKESEEEIMDC